MKTELSITVRGEKEVLTIEYGKNNSAKSSGFDALISLPFSPEKCIGYPVIHAYFEKMEATGYKRYCGFIQFIEKTGIYYKNGDKKQDIIFSLDVTPEFLQSGNPYFAYGYPAEMYDAPCKNIGGYDKLLWRAYTYLIDPPSGMNDERLSCLTGFSWGYEEDQSGPVDILEFKTLSDHDWQKHVDMIRNECSYFDKFH